jgi:pyruvate dehydrogenase E2 component (dihydrolipoamide acetyltransferase)
MAKILEMPKLSPTMEEGRLATWHKKEGDSVDVDDLLAEVETDKATMEFRSFDKGTILKILAPAGTNVVLGQPVAILGQPGEDVSALEAKAGGAKASGADAPKAEAQVSPAPAPVNPPPAGKSSSGNAGSAHAAGGNAGATAVQERAQERAAAPPPPEPEPTADGRVKASPYVRKLAREGGYDLRRIRGTGPHGRIVQRDLASAPKAGDARASSPGRAPAAPGELAAPESKPLSMMRKTIARRLVESKQQVPHFYLTVDYDVDALVALRERINEDLAAMVTGDEKPEKVSLNDLIVKACAIALRRVPQCNAQFTPEAILFHQRVDISVAVAVDDGLVTPIVRDADRKTVREIGAEIRALAGKARSKKLRPEEMTNGTFSISNLGMYGIDSFAAVINPPEGAILAVGQVRKEPVVRGEKIEIGQKLACTLSCDHRVVDGAVGATFLKELRLLLEHPTRILV